MSPTLYSTSSLSILLCTAHRTLIFYTMSPTSSPHGWWSFIGQLAPSNSIDFFDCWTRARTQLKTILTAKKGPERIFTPFSWFCFDIICESTCHSSCSRFDLIRFSVPSVAFLSFQNSPFSHSRQRQIGDGMIPLMTRQHSPRAQLIPAKGIPRAEPPVRHETVITRNVRIACNNILPLYFLSNVSPAAR